jgi:hypothetical protein
MASAQLAHLGNIKQLIHSELQSVKIVMMISSQDVRAVMKVKEDFNVLTVDQ